MGRHFRVPTAIGLAVPAQHVPVTRVPRTRIPDTPPDEPRPEGAAATRMFPVRGPACPRQPLPSVAARQTLFPFRLSVTAGRGNPPVRRNPRSHQRFQRGRSARVAPTQFFWATRRFWRRGVPVPRTNENRPTVTPPQAAGRAAGVLPPARRRPQAGPADLQFQQRRQVWALRERAESRRRAGRRSPSSRGTSAGPAAATRPAPAPRPASAAVPQPQLRQPPVRPVNQPRRRHAVRLTPVSREYPQVRQPAVQRLSATALRSEMRPSNVSSSRDRGWL